MLLLWGRNPSSLDFSAHIVSSLSAFGRFRDRNHLTHPWAETLSAQISVRSSNEVMFDSKNKNYIEFRVEIDGLNLKIIPF